MDPPGKPFPGGTPAPFFSNSHIKFTFLKNPMAWFQKLSPSGEPESSFVRYSFSERPDGSLEKVASPAVEHPLEPLPPGDREDFPMWTLQPGGFRPSALILAEPVGRDAGSIKAFELERKRWFGFFTQTVVFDPKTPRQAVFRSVSDKASPPITITARCALPFTHDGEASEMKGMNSFASTERLKMEMPTPGVISDFVRNGDEANKVNPAFAAAIKSFDWDGTEESHTPGQPVPYDPHDRSGDDDEPNFAIYYSLAPFDPALADYRITEATGTDNFRTWLCLHRRPLTEIELEMEYKMKVGDVSDTTMMLPAVVPVAYIDWESSFNCTFKYPKGEKGFPVAAPDPAKFYCRPKPPSTSLPGGSKGRGPRVGTNWREMDLVEKPRMYFQAPEMSNPNAWTLFPDLRLDVNTPWHVFSYVEQQVPQSATPRLIDYYVGDDNTLDEVDVFIQPRPYTYTGPKVDRNSKTVLYPRALVTREQKAVVRELEEKSGQ